MRYEPAGIFCERLPRSRRPLDFDAVRASGAAQSEMHGQLARAGIAGRRGDAIHLDEAAAPDCHARADGVAVAARANRV